MKSKIGYLLILITIIGTVLGCWYIWIYQGIRYSSEDFTPILDNFFFVELNEDEPLCTELHPQRHYIEGIKLVFVNLTEERKGKITVTLEDKKGVTISESTRMLEYLKVGEWEPFPLKSRVSCKEKYNLIISLSEASEAPYVIGIDGDIAVSLIYAKEGSIYEKSIITLLLLFFVLGVAGIFAFSKTVSPFIGSALGLFCCLTTFILYIPNIAYKIGWINLDDSWRYFLNIAGHKGYVFGRDIFFTYGPLGYICYMMNLPDNGYWFEAGVAIWILVIVAYAYMLYRVYKLYVRGRISLLSIVASTLCTVAAYIVLERDNFLLYLLIFASSIYLLEKNESERHKTYIYITCCFLLTLMFFAKFSTFTSGTAFLVLFVGYQILVCKDRKSVWLLIPGMVAMPLCYLIYNPSFKDLINYVVGILKISSGWMETQQYDFTIVGKDLIALIVIMVCYVALLVTVLITQHKKSGVIFALSAPLFFVYKYASTRHGLACGIWLFGMLYSVIPLTIDFKIPQNSISEKKNNSFRREVATALIMLCITVTGIFQANTVHNSFGNFKETLGSKVYNWTHLNESGIEETVWGDYMTVPERLLNEIGTHTLAVYPYKVALKAAYPDLEVIHYPSVQNANEFIPWIDSKTAEWLDDPQKASSYLLINDETIDNHIKYLDAPLTWRSIQNNYSLVDYEGDWTLLKRKVEEAADYGELELISREVYTTWETIEVPKEADYAVIHTEYSFLGKIK